MQSLVCLHRRVFLLCPPLLDYGFIDNEKCFTMCVQIKLIRHRKKKRHVEEQKKIAKDVAAMWKLPQTNQYTIRQLFTVFENFWKNLIWHACFLMRYFCGFLKHCELCIFYFRMLFNIWLVTLFVTEFVASSQVEQRLLHLLCWRGAFKPATTSFILRQPNYRPNWGCPIKIDEYCCLLKKGLETPPLVKLSTLADKCTSVLPPVPSLTTTSASGE